MASSSIPQKLNSKDIESLVRLTRSDPKAALAALFTIKNKTGALQKLTLNKTQELFHEFWEAMAARGLPIRIENLKYRQGGISTYVDGRLFLKTTFAKGKTYFKISHTEQSVANLFSMSKRAYDYLPDPLRPDTIYSNKYELNYSRRGGVGGLGSQIVTLPAKSAEGLRSFTIHYVHGSEVAFWPDGEKLFTALVGAVPKTADSVIVSETTANGQGNFYYRRFVNLVMRSRIDYSPLAFKNGLVVPRVMDYISKMQPGEWLPVFFPWTLNDEYRLEPPDSFVPNPQESSLMALHGLERDQIFWRRNTLVNEFEGKEHLFSQEYPLTVEEAFIRSGQPRFDTQILSAMTHAITKSQMCPTLSKLIPTADPHTFKEMGAYDGELKIWSRPQPDEQYVVGGDTSEGVVDAQCAVVLRVRDGAVVAVYHEKCPIKIAARKLIFVAAYYNQAYLGVEANSGGLYAAIYAHDNYSNTYVREQVDSIDPDETNKMGWKTTSLSRPLLLADIDSSLVDGGILIPCTDMIGELAAFVLNSNGKFEAGPGFHDDRVMALGIAIQMMKHRPYSAPRPPGFYKSLTSAYQPISKITGY